MAADHAIPIWRHMHDSMHAAQMPSSSCDHENIMSTLWRQEEFLRICSREDLLEKAQRWMSVKKSQERRHNFNADSSFELDSRASVAIDEATLQIDSIFWWFCPRLGQMSPKTFSPGKHSLFACCDLRSWEEEGPLEKHNPNSVLFGESPSSRLLKYSYPIQKKLPISNSNACFFEQWCTDVTPVARLNLLLEKVSDSSNFS